MEGGAATIPDDGLGIPAEMQGGTDARDQSLMEFFTSGGHIRD